MLQTLLKKELGEAVLAAGFPVQDIELEHPSEFSHGDISSNVAMKLAKAAGKNPREVAETIVAAFKKQSHPYAENIEIAGPGFINFHLSRAFFTESIGAIVAAGAAWEIGRAHV